MKFNVKDVLDEYHITYKYESADALKALCPFHDDHNPSAVIFTATGVFHCRTCETSTNLYRYLAKQLGKDVFFEVNRKFGEYADKVIQPETIENAHARIWHEESRTLRQALYDRAITDEDIREHRIGVIKDRLSIPIRNESNYFVNIRLYKPGATEAKFTNFLRFGKPPRLHPIEQLVYDKILLCGGEIKAIAAAKRLNPIGIGAISCTAGEKTLPVNLRSEFTGKIVYVCLDIDERGKEYAVKHALSLSSIADWVGIIELPLDPERYPKGDLNDFLASGGNLREIVEQTPKFEYKRELPYEPVEEPTFLSLSQATSAESTGKRLKLKATVSAMEISPYSIPKTLEVVCDRSEKFCDVCPISMLSPEDQVETISPENPSIIKMTGETDRVQHESCKEALGIPKRCKKCSFKPIEFYNVEEVRISEALDLKVRKTEKSMQAAYCIGDSLELNSSYEMTGRMFPHPKNQQATLLISSYETTEDALDTYVCENPEKLKLFQPKEWSVKGLEEKLKDIYDDLSANITFIYERHDLHLCMDLAYHSPLFINVQGREEKGWVEVLIVGDTAQGKSEVSKNLMNHYSLGDLVECKNATAAGLLGGQENFNRRWFITWGKVPSNDRRLVLFEELKGMKPDVFAKLTETRSSGIAQITGIAKGDQKKAARTRIIANSNSRFDRNISDYNYGVDCLVELIGSREDLRRFDMALIVERNEVDKELFEALKPEYPHKYTSELCRELVLWAWTLDKVRFEDEEYLFKSVSSLYQKFSNDIPLVDTGSMRFKLARLAAALAARTFSVNEDMELLVRNCHIDYIVQYLDRTYSKPSFGYAQYSEANFKAERLVNKEAVKNRILNQVSYPKEFIEHFLFVDRIDAYFIQDLLGYDPDTARKLLSFLIRQRALKKDGRYYRKTKEFIELLKELDVEDARPEFSKKGDEF